MIVLDDLPEVRRKVERIRMATERARGAIDEMLRQLRDDFGCESVEQAEAKLLEFEDDERAAAEAYSAKLAAFKVKWKDVLERFG